MLLLTAPSISGSPERRWTSGGGSPAQGIRQRTDEGLRLKLTPDHCTGLLSPDKRRGPFNTRMHDLTPELSLNVQGCHLLASEEVLLPAGSPPALALTPAAALMERLYCCVLGGIAHETDCKALDRDSLSCDLALT